MAFETQKTNHVGAKNGGGEWCCRAVAKAESSRVRRQVDDRAAVSDGRADYLFGAAVGYRVSVSPSQGIAGELPFKAR